MPLQPDVQGAAPFLTTCAVVDADSAYGGGHTHIWVRHIYQADPPPNPTIRGYLRFDLGGIPEGAQITSAKLRLYMEDANGAEPAEIGAWRLTQDWSPATLSEMNQPTFAFGPYTSTLGSNAGWKSWDITELVGGWASGAAPNYGLVLAGPEIAQDAVGGGVLKSAITFERQFRTSEYGLRRGASDASPCLQISYTMPTTRQRQSPWLPQPVWTPVPQPTTSFFLPIPALYNFGVADIRLYQTINYYQLGANQTPGVPLIGGKPTLVRVFVTNDADQPKSVTVTLRAFRGSSELAPCAGVVPKTRMLADTTDIPNFLVSPDVQEDLAWTFNWVLPADCAWVQAGAGDVHFKATLKGDIGSGDGDQNPADDSFTGGNFSFLSMRPLRIKPYIFTYQKPGSAHQGDQASLSQLAADLDYLKNLYPVSALDVRAPTFMQSTRNLDFDNSSGQFLSAFGDFLDGFEDCCGVDSVDSNLALLPGSLFCCAGAQGLSWTNSRYAVANVGSLSTTAHEIGHNLGLIHRSNDHGEGGDIENLHDHGEMGGIGWDIARPNKFIGTHGQLPQPWHSHDLMSYGGCSDFAEPAEYGDSLPTYCEGEWISPLNYARIAQRLQCSDPQTLDEDDNDECLSKHPFDTVIDNAFGPATWARDILHAAFMGVLSNLAALQPGAQAGSIRITARVFEDGPVELLPFAVSSAPARGRGLDSGRGAYRLELRADDDTVLVGRSFEPKPITTHGRVDRWSVDQTLAWDPATRRIVLLLDGSVIAERRVSASAPTVVLRSPNGGEQLGASGLFTVSWQGQDPDGDGLSYTLQYSADGGRTWDTVGRNLAETSFDLDLAGVPGGRQSLLRVVASDGVLTAEDTSDQVFEVDGKAPYVGIGAPLDGAVLAGSERVRLRGLATDTEDGMLHGSALVWSSDRDGLLGSGESIDARLSVGQHRLTLTVDDSAGKQTVATVEVTIR